MWRGRGGGVRLWKRIDDVNNKGFALTHLLVYGVEQQHRVVGELSRVRALLKPVAAHGGIVLAGDHALEEGGPGGVVREGVVVNSLEVEARLLVELGGAREVAGAEDGLGLQSDIDRSATHGSEDLVGSR